MDKDRIRRVAYGRMSRIEETYCDNLPDYIQKYWLLNYLIAEGLRAYVASYGLLPLHAGDCGDGREELELGPLSGFERDVITHLNDHIDQAERLYEQRHLTSASSCVRTIGLARS